LSRRKTATAETLSTVGIVFYPWKPNAEQHKGGRRGPSRQQSLRASGAQLSADAEQRIKALSDKQDSRRTRSQPWFPRTLLSFAARRLEERMPVCESHPFHGN
jgi:hypothetical protein